MFFVPKVALFVRLQSEATVSIEKITFAPKTLFKNGCSVVGAVLSVVQRSRSIVGAVLSVVQRSRSIVGAVLSVVQRSRSIVGVVLSVVQRSRSIVGTYCRTSVIGISAKTRKICAIRVLSLPCKTIKARNFERQ